MKVELIEWVDSYGCSSDWSPINNIKNDKPLMCKSVGYIAAESKEYITVVPHISSEHENAESQGCGDMTIPIVSIVKRKVIEDDN